MIFKFKNWILIPSLLASLSLPAQIVDCKPGNAGPDLVNIGRLAEDTSIVAKNLSEESVLSACYTPSAPVTNERFIPHGSYPPRPQNIVASCDCVKSNNLYLKDEELEEKWQRIQDLTAMKLKMDFYLKAREVARGGIEAFLLTADKSDLPSTCQALLDRGPAVRQTVSCRDDQAKVYDLMTKVLPSFPNYNEDINAITDSSFARRPRTRTNSNEAGAPPAHSPMFVAPPGYFELFKMRAGMAYSQIDSAKRTNMSDAEMREEMRLRLKSINSTDVVKSGLYSPLPLFFGPSEELKKVTSEDVENVDPQILELLSKQIGKEMTKLNRSLADNKEFQEAKEQATTSMAFIELARKYVPFRFNLSFSKDDVTKDLNEDQKKLYKSMAKLMEGTDILGMPFGFDKLFKLNETSGEMEFKNDLNTNIKHVLGYAQVKAGRVMDLAGYCGMVQSSARKICERSNERQSVSQEEIQLFSMADLDEENGPEYVKAVCTMARSEDLEERPSSPFRIASNSNRPVRRDRCYYNRPARSFEREGYSTMFFSFNIRGMVNRLMSTEAPAECEGAKEAYQDAVVDTTKAGFDGPISPEQALTDKIAEEASSEYAQGSFAIPLASFNDNEAIATSRSRSSYDDFFTSMMNGDNEENSPDVVEETYITKNGKATPYSITTTGDDDTQYVAGTNFNSPSTIADHVVEADPAGATSQNNFLSTASNWLGGNNDADRYSIYDKVGLDGASVREGESKETGAPINEREIAVAQEKLEANNGRYDAIMDQLSKMREELEKVKDGKNDEDVDDLIADLKKQMEEVKKSREELEERIAKEKERERDNDLRESKAAISRPTPNVTWPSVARSDDARVSPQPTYTADSIAPASKVSMPTFGGGNVSGASNVVASNKKAETAVVASEFAQGTISGGNRGSSVSAAMATGALRMTSQAFEKLSTNDLKDIYESNGGKPIFVEIEGSNNDNATAVMKYVPKVVGEDIVYIMQEEIAEATTDDVKALNEVLEESVNPGRKIASVDETHEFADERAEMPEVRVIKEVESFEHAIYNPIHDDLILRFQQVMTGQQ